jgi:hypothetical protein
MATRHFLREAKLALSERGLSIACEELAWGEPGSTLDLLVEVHEVEPQLCGHRTAERGLPGTGETDEDEVQCLRTRAQFPSEL